jgi:phosphonate transport system permease protein
MMKSNELPRKIADPDYPEHLTKLLKENISPERRYSQYAIKFSMVLLVMLVLYWSGKGADISASRFINGMPAILNYLSRMFPPDWSYLKVIWIPTIETIEIAIWGTLLSIIVAVPLGFLAALNIAPHRVIFEFSRFTLNALRGVSELVFALVFVSAVGLGPFPGVLALALHNAGMLGKFFAEAIEAVDPGPMEALKATGATWSQGIVYAIIPQIVPHFVTYTLYRFEVSIRAATVLGLVGAGGIGFHLISSIRLFDYQTTSVILITIVLLTVITDFVGTKIRSKII